MSDSDTAAPVNAKGAKTVYAIPARPAPPVPWWQENFGGLVILWACVAMIFILLGE